MTLNESHEIKGLDDQNKLKKKVLNALSKTNLFTPTIL